jgi:hypothetical protein
MAPPDDPRLAHPCRTGNATLIVLVIFALLGFAALAIDIGSARVVRAEIQAAVDAAAVGAVAYLQEHQGAYADDLAIARRRAIDIAAMNDAYHRPVTVDPNPDNTPGEGVVFGAYDRTTKTFRPSLDPATVNAVQVHARVDDVQSLFGLAAFGYRELVAGASAIAVKGDRGGAGKVACLLPFGLPSCLFDTPSDLQTTDLKLQPANGDNISWASPFGQPTPARIREQLEEPCEGGTTEIGDRLYLSNGAEQSALAAVAEHLDDTETHWNTTLWGPQPPRMAGSALSPSGYGHTYEGVVPLFQAGPEYCDNIVGNERWNDVDAKISGFAWGAIYDVRTSGGAAQRNLRARLDLLTERDFGLATGGVNYGIVAENPDAIVR